MALNRLGSFLAVSVAAGAVTAGLLTPVVGGLGLLANRGISSWDRLPSALDVAPLPTASKIYTADGHLLATFYSQDRIPVTLGEIPEVMQKAIISIEDDRFYAEQGLDIRGLIRAAVNDARGGARQGGSTLTQQYVKNILLNEAHTPAQQAAATADTLQRKIQEARYALALSRRMSKAQILEGYLNIAYFGDGAYGVGAAAEHYFDEPVQRLDLAQAALLAGIVENPSLYDPALHPQYAEARRNVVLARMAQLGAISQAQAGAAEASRIQLHLTLARNGCVGTPAPYFCDYVVDEVLANPAFGANSTQRAQLLQSGGLIIHTTLASADQAAAQHALETLAPWDGHVGAAEVMVQPNTGAIRAMALNAPYGSAPGENSVNWAANASDGDSLGFPAGSSFKLFVLAAALQQGIPLDTTIYSPPSMGPLSGYTNCAGDQLIYPSVHNAEAAEGGLFNIITATWASVNTFYAQLEQRTGLCLPATFAGELGVTQASGAPLQQVPSMVLGSNDVSPVDMAGAYAAIADSGRFCPPVAITEVTDANGRPLPFARASCRQVLPPGLANTITSVLTGVLDQPTGTAYGSALPGRPAAGKTGTVDSFHDAWFDGYTPQLAAAVWVGYPHNQNDDMVNVTIGGRFYSAVYGASLPAPIWQMSMEGALAGAPVRTFPPPDPRYERGNTVKVPNLGRESSQAAITSLSALGLGATVAAGSVPSVYPAGTVAFTSPPAGASDTVGSTVTLFLSSGQPPPVSLTPSPAASSPPPGPSPGPSGGPAPPGGSPSPPAHKKH
jgi:membrane peptidoglycan carboxypeptidase